MKNSYEFFDLIKKDIIGNDSKVLTPFGEKKIVYFDWTASGRLYRPIEEKIMNVVGPMVANTHTESNSTGSFITNAYHEALNMIKGHVNANDNDVIITDGSGTTGVINKLQRILGLKCQNKFNSKNNLEENERPVVFITHMEHHSNQVSWIETVADVVVVEPNNDGLVDPDNLAKYLNEYKDRPLKIGSFTACSNVTGVKTPYHKLAKVMHEYGGYCFIDFAASAPYVTINMHPEDPLESLDAIFFSPHKFLGGPGTSGVLVFNSALYQNEVPDNPGGGTVLWTNPWGGRRYFDNIEVRENGGTPDFLQVIRIALAIKLKEKMINNGMDSHKNNLFHYLWERLSKNEEIVILDKHNEERIGIVSFYVEKIHYNLLVKLLDERFGIQVRGGCSCAGTYGHYLLNIEKKHSQSITDKLNEGELSVKPGWVRVSIHPTTTKQEIDLLCDALNQIIVNYDDWKKDYNYNPKKNEFEHVSFVKTKIDNIFEI